MGMSAAAARQDHEARSQRRGRQRKEVLPPSCGADVPFRVEEGQAHRPAELAQVEPERPAGKQDAFGRRQGENRADPLEQPAFHRKRDEADGAPEREPRQERQNVPAQAEARAPPPDHDEKHGRQGHNDGLAQERQREQPDGEPVPRAAALPVEFQVRDRGA